MVTAGILVHSWNWMVASTPGPSCTAETYYVSVFLMESSTSLSCSPSGHFEHCHLRKCQWHRSAYQALCQSSAALEPSALAGGSRSQTGGGNVTEHGNCQSIGSNKGLLKVQWPRSIMQNQMHNTCVFLAGLSPVTPYIISETLLLSPQHMCFPVRTPVPTNSA